LLDVCCFETALDSVERARGWPDRSGRIVLGFALDRLARYYGMVASGPDRAGAIGTWHGDDAVPDRATH
jgi:hypothetical protein